MMRIEASSALRQCTTAIPVPGISGEHPQISKSEAVHGVQSERRLCLAVEPLQLPLEEQDRGQGVMGEVIRGRGLDRTPCSRICSPEGIRPNVEGVVVFLPENYRQHCPCGSISRGLLNRPLQ